MKKFTAAKLFQRNREVRAKGHAQRGFTLFTALIAFILIVLAMLLVQSMVSTQRSASDIILSISEQEEMQAVADLSRADALQVVNYGIRYDIENFSTKDSAPADGYPDNPYILFANQAADWDVIKLDFMKDKFGIIFDPGFPKCEDQPVLANGQGNPNCNNQFVSSVSSHILQLLETTADTRGYSIQISKPNSAVMTEVLAKSFKKNFDTRRNESFEVIKCDSTYKGCIGSFYVTIDLNPGILNDEDYEKLPQVRVERLVGTGEPVRVLKEPVLPRGQIRIYVPTRLFKALSGAREIGLSDGSLFTQGFDYSMPRGQRTAGQVQTEVGAYAQARINSAIGQIASRENLGPDLADDGFVFSGANIVVSPVSDNHGTADTSDDTAKVSTITVKLYFTENNLKYKVHSGLPKVYGIELYRAFD